ncbi:MAG: YchJ family protein [Verrucomicrobiales bacterium]
MSEGQEELPKTRGESLCPCKSRKSYAICCMPFHHGKETPDTAEQLMRARYSAYFFRLVDYLVDTTHPDTKKPGLRKDLQKTVPQVNWANLEILDLVKGGKDDKVGKVEFVADYFVEGQPYELHERSRFRRYRGAWKYMDGKTG